MIGSNIFERCRSCLAALRGNRKVIYASIVAGFGVLVLAGYLEGRWTGRWQGQAKMADAVARLDNVPKQIGDWDSTDAELDPDQREASGADGFLLRQYMNARGSRVALLLVCGRPGPVSVHTPDVCYQGIGAIVGDPDDRTIKLGEDGDQADLKAIRVRSAADRPVQGRLEVFWTWNARGRWENPRNPRMAFARFSHLYKLYLIRNVEQGELEEDDPSPAFLKLLLPELNKALFPE